MSQAFPSPTFLCGELRKPRQMFVGEPYLLEREIIALSQSKRTESMWIKTSVLDAKTRELKAEVILNSATVKDSYARYAEDAKALGA